MCNSALIALYHLFNFKVNVYFLSKAAIVASHLPHLKVFSILWLAISDEE